MFAFSSSGDFKNTEKFLKKMTDGDLYSNLDRYGTKGIDALAKATPVASGLTANSWGFRVIRSKTNPGIEWFNTNVNDGSQIVILIQYGHATGTGGYVQGREFINQAIRPIFDEIVADVWKQVTK